LFFNFKILSLILLIFPIKGGKQMYGYGYGAGCDLLFGPVGGHCVGAGIIAIAILILIALGVIF
jgi:hypothetical protein